MGEILDTCQARFDQPISVQLSFPQCEVTPMSDDDITVVKTSFTRNASAVTTRAQKRHEMDLASMQTMSSSHLLPKVCVLQ